VVSDLPTAPLERAKSANGRRIKVSDTFLAPAIYKYAEDHYTDGGWDVIVECWTLDMIEDYIIEGGARTFVEAVALFKNIVDVWADQQADAINSAF
jgi:hypothetical protein